MNNTDDSASDEEQLETVPMDYRALLAMTRPLVIAEDTFLSLQGEESPGSGFGISPEPADWRAEFALRRGEGVATTVEGVSTSSDSEGECDVARESISALDQIGLNLGLRIYLGMS
jgi:hypothetical protein